MLRCGACGEHMVATSFIAVSNTDGEFSAYCDPGYGRPPAPEARIARGPLRDISATVLAETDRGTIVLLIAETQ
nr:hypothetical protein [Rhizobium sp. P38BS-XIX]